MKNFFTFLFLLATSLSANEISYNLFGEVLFLQPNGSNLFFAAQAVPQNPALADPLLEAHWFEHEIHPDYHPAFQVGAEVQFHCLGMNLLLDYSRLRTRDLGHLSVENGVSMVGPLFDIGPDAEAYIIAKGKAVFYFDAADLYLEKLFYDNNCWKIHFAFGSSFARIKQYMRTEYFSGNGSVGRVIKTPAQFIGAGPLAGINFNYRLLNHFQLTGCSSLALLMGEMKNKTTYRSFSPTISAVGNSQPTTERSRTPTRSQLVPALEEKIGFTFDFPFRCGGFTLETGYLFQIFLDAIQTYDIDVIVTVGLPFPTADGYYAQGFRRTLSNFILTGPYLKLNVDF